ncbi:hypothetical protein EIP91_002688 [Steccherinum ochraceum]|uniref:UDP-glycosyltransferases domain-containing protein n=1 Tax=Steccherinum ochraceum TaxID=92696 RepID=A0A4R0RDK8_9APHY|nr:hypothetical protein EIP91_002688 [Steccherinum ochraceum]
MSPTDQYPHLVIANVEPWGHARPVCAFAAKVALVRDVQVTLFTSPAVYERIVKEVGRAFGPQDADRLQLIRIVALDNVVEGVVNFLEKMKAEIERYIAALVDTYQQLLDKKPITCFATKTEFAPAAVPTMLVFDFMIGSLMDAVRSLPNNKAKLVGFCSGMVSFLHLSFAPAERGGRANFKEKIIKEAERSKRHVFDVADDMYHDFTDEVVQIPGFPKMYHWEFDPQETRIMTKGFFGSIWMSLFDTMEKADGLILTSPEVYESAGIADTREWLAEKGRSVWAIGPIISSPSSEQAVKGEQAQSQNAPEVMKFLDDTMAKHGENSLLYISFGSAFWPSEPEKLEAFIDVVIERKIPFIMSHGSPLAQLTDTFKAKVQESGLGLLSSWSPQQTILTHKALGWFVSHCGHNSSLEAVSSGTPLICWPFHADQPANAVNLTENHNVAYELLEVRTGPHGLKPIYRTGKAPTGTVEAIRTEAHDVLAKAFGEDGARKRANVKKLQAKIQAAASKGGSGEVDLGRLLDTVIV